MNEIRNCREAPRARRDAPELARAKAQPTANPQAVCGALGTRATSLLHSGEARQARLLVMVGPLIEIEVEIFARILPPDKTSKLMPVIQ